MATISNELENLAKSFKIYRFSTELGNLKENNDDDAKIEKISKILNSLNDIPDSITVTNKIHSAFSEIDKQVYKKPWSKLPDFHRIIKMKEYISENYPEDKSMQELLLDSINKHKLNTDKTVIYDQIRCKIVSIPALVKEDNCFKVEIKLNKNKINKKVIKKL